MRPRNYADFSREGIYEYTKTFIGLHQIVYRKQLSHFVASSRSHVASSLWKRLFATCNPLSSTLNSDEPLLFVIELSFEKGKLRMSDDLGRTGGYLGSGIGTVDGEK